MDKIIRLFTFICLMGLIFSCVSTPELVTNPFPGRIQVDGNRLVVDGKVTRLRGTSIADPYELEYKREHFKEELFQAAADWNFNVVRIPIHPGFWQAEPDYVEKFLDPIMDWAQKYELYIILDWHSIGNPQTGQAQNPGWKEEDFIVYDARWELAEQAWKILAERYGKYPFVIFEIFNEPVALDKPASFGLWSKRLSRTIKELRSLAPDTLVLVSGWQWSLDLTGFRNAPVQDSNVAYIAHVYPNHHEWEKNFGFLAAKHPIVVSEWGFAPDVDKDAVYYGNRQQFGQSFLRYMEEKEMSWISWCFDPVWNPPLIKNWKFKPTESGKMVKSFLEGKSAPPRLKLTYPADGDTIQGRVNLEGLIEDDKGLLAVNVKIGGEEFQPAELLYTPSFSSAVWSYGWNTYKYPNGTYPVIITGLDLSMNKVEKKITLKLDNPIDTEIPDLQVASPNNADTVSGQLEVEFTIDDPSGIDSIKVFADEEYVMGTGSVNTVELIYSEKQGTFVNLNPPYGLFASYKWDGTNFSGILDTRRLSNGKHDLVFQGTDIFNNKTEKKVEITVDNGLTLSSCEILENWRVYGGGGSQSESSLVEGVKEKAVKVVFDGSSTGWWGLSKRTFQDFSGYKGVSFYMKGNGIPFRFSLSDREFKIWEYKLIPTEDWQKVEILFDDLTIRGDYQPSEAAKNSILAIDRVLEFQFIHAIEAQGGAGEFFVDEIQLIEK